MVKPMDDIRVVEVALYAMVPTVGAVLAEWGADVVKIEHPVHGDPVRGLTVWGIKPGTGGFNHNHEIVNRGKRSIGLDLESDQGRAVLYDLVRDADVFLTNFLPEARTRLKIDADDLMAINPRLVYGRGSGYGPRGPEAQRGGFDGITYWHRTGISSSLTPRDADEVTNMPVPGFGDIQTSMSLLAGVSAGLRQRDRTGQGVVVDVSLLSAGMWAMSMALAGANAIGEAEMPKFRRADAPSPLANTYRTADGRFVMLAMLQSDQYWRRLCEVVLERPDLVDEPRFATHELRDQHARECVVELDKIFAQHDLAHWTAGLAQQEGQWESVAAVGDLNNDEQAWANGYLQRVPHDDGREITLVSTPIQFDGAPGLMGQAPEHGGSTEELLLELGMDWERIMELKDEHVIN